MRGSSRVLGKHILSSLITYWTYDLSRSQFQGEQMQWRDPPHDNQLSIAGFPPPNGYAKLNVDGALNKQGWQGVIATVCRDWDGMFLGSSVVVFAGLTNPTTLNSMRLVKHLH